MAKISRSKLLLEHSRQFTDMWVLGLEEKNKAEIKALEEEVPPLKKKRYPREEESDSELDVPKKKRPKRNPKKVKKSGNTMEM